MYRKYNNCSCMNNMQQTKTNKSSCSCINEQLIEEDCSQTNFYEDTYDKCSCGFMPENNELADNMQYGQSYVPNQIMDKTFKPCVGLKMGTIFPELVSMYMPLQSMKEYEILRNGTKFGEECQKC